MRDADNKPIATPGVVHVQKLRDYESGRGLELALKEADYFSDDEKRRRNFERRDHQRMKRAAEHVVDKARMANVENRMHGLLQRFQRARRPGDGVEDFRAPAVIARARYDNARDNIPPQIPPSVPRQVRAQQRNPLLEYVQVQARRIMGGGDANDADDADDADDGFDGFDADDGFDDYDANDGYNQNQNQNQQHQGQQHQQNYHGNGNNDEEQPDLGVDPFEEFLDGIRESPEGIEKHWNDEEYAEIVGIINTLPTIRSEPERVSINMAKNLLELLEQSRLQRVIEDGGVEQWKYTDCAGFEHFGEDALNTRRSRAENDNINELNNALRDWLRMYKRNAERQRHGFNAQAWINQKQMEQLLAMMQEVHKTMVKALRNHEKRRARIEEKNRQRSQMRVRMRTRYSMIEDRFFLGVYSELEPEAKGQQALVTVAKYFENEETGSFQDGTWKVIAARHQEHVQQIRAWNEAHPEQAQKEPVGLGFRV